MLYLDTSILVCALTNEARTAEVQNWIAQQEPSRLTISDWVVTEVSSAFSIKLRTGQLTPTQRAASLAQFTQLATDTFHMLPFEPAAFRSAARFCNQDVLNLRAGDALHVALCAVHGATLCTLDKRLGQAAPQLGVACISL